jgi:hypothetical protein
MGASTTCAIRYGAQPSRLRTSAALLAASAR